jgi:hypothetical protein
MAAGRYFSRVVLQRLLGAGRFTILDSGGGPQRSLKWDCGCRAHEEDEDAFELCPCLKHHYIPNIPVSTPARPRSPI